MDVTIYGDGTQPCSLVNFGNLGKYMMLELTKLVLDMTGSKSEIIHKPFPDGGPIWRRPVIDLAKKELNWELHIPLKEGVLPTIMYFELQMD